MQNKRAYGLPRRGSVHGAFVFDDWFHFFWNLICSVVELTV